jgi:hypothetical protein
VGTGPGGGAVVHVEHVVVVVDAATLTVTVEELFAVLGSARADVAVPVFENEPVRVVGASTLSVTFAWPPDKRLVLQVIEVPPAPSLELLHALASPATAAVTKVPAVRSSVNVTGEAPCGPAFFNW